MVMAYLKDDLFFHELDKYLVHFRSPSNVNMLTQKTIFSL